MIRLINVFRRTPLSPAQRESIEFYLAISPWLVGFVLFTGGPVLFSLVMSFTNWTGLTTMKWVGLGNFIRLFTDDRLFWDTVRNTFYYSFGSVSLGTLGALSVAVLLNQKVPGVSVFRTLYYLPSVTTGVAVAIMWLWIFNPSIGLLNYMLSWVGIKGPGWLGSTDWAMPAFILMSLWGIGGNMVVLLAGLQGIPVSLYEAARIDGASRWHELRHVTFPMLSPVLFYVVVISIIGSFQTFTNVYVMTRGGPGTSTLVYEMYLFQNAFEFLKMGYGSALAWVFFAIILGLTAIQFRIGSQWVYYEYQGGQ